MAIGGGAPVPPVAAAIIAAAGFLLRLYEQKAAEAAVRAAADRFGLDLNKPEDIKAAIAYAYVQRAGPRVLAALAGEGVDRSVAAEAVMEAVRERPGLLDDALNGIPQAVQALHDAITASATALETRDDE